MNSENISIDSKTLVLIDLADQMIDFENNMHNLAFLGESISMAAENHDDPEKKNETIVQLKSLLNAMSFVAVVHHHLQEHKLQVRD